MLEILVCEDNNTTKELYNSLGLEYCEEYIAIRAMNREECLGFALFCIEGSSETVFAVEPKSDIMLADGLLRSALHVGTERGVIEAFYSGEDYVELSFLYARNTVEKLGADIKLFYNDYNTFNTDKMLAIRNLAKSINNFAFDEKGNPRKLVDGIGMQGYIGGYGTQSGCLVDSHPGMIRSAILGYAAQGLKVQITEMAVRNFEPAQADKHAQFYAKLFDTFMGLHSEEGNPLNGVSIWGLTDYPNEPKGTYTYNLNSPYGGLITEKYELKTSFDTVHSVMSK